MPSLNGTLGADGPLLLVYVGVSLPHSAVLKKLNKPVPSQLHGQFLIDTGASCSCADPAFLLPLGLSPSSYTDILTPNASEQQRMPCYSVSLQIPNIDPGVNPWFIAAHPLVATQTHAQGISGLIGRDVLDRCTLIYNGSARTFSLAY